MIYKIDQGVILTAAEESEGNLGVFSFTQWQQNTVWNHWFSNMEAGNSVRVCKMEQQFDYLEGSFCFPSKTPDGQDIRFACRFSDNRLCMLEETGVIDQIAKEKSSLKLRADYNVACFFSDCLDEMIRQDLLYLETLEEDIESIETMVIQNTLDDIDIRLLELKKKLSRFYKCYSQLQDAIQVILENEGNIFTDQDLILFRLVCGRAERLQSETRMLMENTTQVQELYVAQIDCRQNKIMKVLTLLTSIFFPLTLIVGWYGMNFTNMPELKWAYGYPAVIVLSVAVVGFCILYFKRKKYF